MLYFPQLATGSLVTLPIKKSIYRRTVINNLLDGSQLKVADSDAAETTWVLSYSGLTNQEQAAIEQFFETCEGRLRSFCWFDPSDNLLSFSEDLTDSVWHVDTAIRQDGLQLTNGAQTWSSFRQTVEGPKAYRWCISADVKGSGQLNVRLGSLESAYTCTAEWQQVACTGELEGEPGEIDFGFALGAGASVTFQNILLQAQSAPGDYKRTEKRSGVYPTTRFDQDILTFTADAYDSNSAVIRLRSRTQ